MSEIPPIPSNYGCITVAFEIPSWMLSVAYSVLAGKGEADAVNGISYDALGDLVLYRKPTDTDRTNFSQLHGVESIWITFDQALPFD